MPLDTRRRHLTKSLQYQKLQLNMKGYGVTPGYSINKKNVLSSCTLRRSIFAVKSPMHTLILMDIL